MLKIRCYDPTDAIGLLDMFRHTIRAINSADYAPTQIDAWASDEIDVNEWRERFADRFAHVAMLDGRIVGFTDMTTTGHLDRLFVSAKHQRQGIARALLASNSSIFRGVLHGAPSRGSFNFFSQMAVILPDRKRSALTCELLRQCSRCHRSSRQPPLAIVRRSGDAYDRWTSRQRLD